MGAGYYTRIRMVSARQILHLHAACAGAVNAIKEKFMMFTMWNNGKLVNKGIQNTEYRRQTGGWMGMGECRKIRKI